MAQWGMTAQVLTPTTLPVPVKNTLRFGVIGSPIAHSLSPVMHLAGWQALRQPAEYFRIEIPAGELAPAVPQLVQAGFAGWNCTLPHKNEMFRLCSKHDSSALESKSVNTVQIVQGQVHGASTDAAGWLRASLEIWPNTLPSDRILLLGCGGVGQAIARFLARTGCGSLTLVNRDAPRANKLLQELAPLVAQRFPLRQLAWNLSLLETALQETDLLLHATSLGLRPEDAPPLPASLLRPPLRVFDTIYHPNETSLVRSARQQGCLATDGLSMLLHQGVLSFEIWAKKPAPVAAMRTALFQAAGRSP